MSSPINSLSLVLAAGLFIVAVVTPSDVRGETVKMSDLATYYFPRAGSCTSVVDFQNARSALNRMAENERKRVLLESTTKKFFEAAQEKCGKFDVARIFAVYIPGTDNYGRPDFGGRVNLMRIEGRRENFEKFLNLKSEVGSIELQSLLSVEFF